MSYTSSKDFSAAVAASTTRALSFLVESKLGPSFLFEHDLFRKPVPTFRDHALARGSRDTRASANTCEAAEETTGAARLDQPHDPAHAALDRGLDRIEHGVRTLQP